MILSYIEYISKIKEKLFKRKIFLFLKTIKINLLPSFLIKVRVLLYFKDFSLQTIIIKN